MTNIQTQIAMFMLWVSSLFLSTEPIDPNSYKNEIGEIVRLDVIDRQLHTLSVSQNLMRIHIRALDGTALPTSTEAISSFTLASNFITDLLTNATICRFSTAMGRHYRNCATAEIYIIIDHILVQLSMLGVDISDIHGLANQYRPTLVNPSDLRIPTNPIRIGFNTDDMDEITPEDAAQLFNRLTNLAQNIIEEEIGTSFTEIEL